MTDDPHKQAREHRAEESAGTGAGRDQGEQAPSLLRPEYVRHQAPGHRDDEQVEYRQPDVEHARQPDAFRMGAETAGERQQIGDEERVDPGNEPRARHGRAERAVGRHRQQHRQKGRGEQPLEVLHAAGDAHSFPQGPQHGVSGKQAEEHAEASNDCRQLATIGFEQAMQEFRWRRIPASRIIRILSHPQDTSAAIRS